MRTKFRVLFINDNEELLFKTLREIETYLHSIEEFADLDYFTIRSLYLYNTGKAKPRKFIHNSTKTLLSKLSITDL